MKPHIETLVRAFGALTPEERGRMLAWVEAGKPICCHTRAEVYFDPSDGAT